MSIFFFSLTFEEIDVILCIFGVFFEVEVLVIVVTGDIY